MVAAACGSGDTPQCLYDTIYCSGDCCEHGKRMWDDWQDQQDRNAENEYEEEEMGEIEVTLKDVSDSLIKAIDENIAAFRIKLEEVEKRAKYWEEECQKLQKQLQTNPGILVAEKMNEMYEREKLDRAKDAGKSVKEYEAHNVKVREKLDWQLKIMEDQSRLSADSNKMYAEMMVESKKQTAHMADMANALIGIWQVMKVQQVTQDRKKNGQTL